MQTVCPTILNPKQAFVYDNVLANPLYKEICLYGSSRSGKTFLTADFLHNRSIAYPGSFHLYVRATLTALTTGVVSQTFPQLFKVYKAKTGLDFNEAKDERGRLLVQHKGNPYNRYEYANGSEIRFIGLDTVSTNKTALDKVLSQEYLTIVIEEGPEMDFEVVEMLKTRLAQRVKHFVTGNPGRPKLLVTLNPRLFEDWDYVYFQQKKNPKDKTLIKDPERITAIHFDLADNIENVSDDYLDILQGLSASKQLRFLEGKHGDSFEGEIFKKILWDKLPAITEFDQLIIYTDPSYKSGPKNDFKASVLVGRRQGAFWIIGVKAQQTTTAQMVMNVHELYYEAQQMGWTRHIPVWFENAGMPDDFETAVTTHAINNGWTCPFQLDGRDKGDKYARIETILEPLSRNGKLIFNIDIKDQAVGNLVVVQFLNFRKNLMVTEHDDIPDAVHGAVTLINQPSIRPGGTTHHRKDAIPLG